MSGPGLVVEGLRQWLLLGEPAREKWPRAGQDLLAAALARFEGLRTGGAADAAASVTAVKELHGLLTRLPTGYEAAAPLPFEGELRPAAVEAVRCERREAARERFVKMLAAVLPAPPRRAGNPDRTKQETAAGPAIPDQAALAMLLSAAPNPDASGQAGQKPVQRITLGDAEVELPEPLLALARMIRQDLGAVPQRYIASAVGIAGRGGPGPEGAEADNAPQPSPGPLVYDEWDYRRNGFRKNWCTLVPKQIQPVKGTFVATTLAEYRGPLRQLRRQFEMMRAGERLLRRQPDGDDLDPDAVTEMLADRQAGLAPSERLYIRLRRDERSIEAVFLVDMSSSTEGWVSTALKEALVLMCEALAVLGDRYAIYGFSGMRRLRSDLYHIKHSHEPYDDTVRGRIAAIMPREYTRMGPALRHVTAQLGKSDAKVRLLITLSDGKPEDYDDYKGRYAIEDTRHALIEAKARGIHPFCITIDRAAHDYMPYMYGEVNYIFVDDVRKLPVRMPEIYRRLTT